MNFDLPEAAATHVDRAQVCARDVLTSAAPDIDRAGRIPEAVRQELRAVMSADACRDGVTFAAVVEELAVVSAAAALTAAAGALDAVDAVGAADDGPQWPGLRGADVDGLRARLGGDARWDIAVTAVFVGLARAAVEHATTALRAAIETGTPNAAAEAPLADAATVRDAARLLLWDAARVGHTGETASAASRGMARLQALDAVALGLAAAERATDAEASRPGAVLERISRDAATAVRVLGDAVAAQAAVAGAARPG